MKWLRLYSEARTDAKLESLPDDEFRVWHRLLCFANEQPQRGTLAHYTPRLLAVEVARGDVTLLQRTLTSLEELRIIEAGDDAYYFVHWQARQYDKPSATPERVAERVNAYRERQRNADVTPCNALEEDTEAETDPEAELSSPATPTLDDAQEPVDAADVMNETPHLSEFAASIVEAVGLAVYNPKTLTTCLKRYDARPPDDLLAEASKAGDWWRTKHPRKQPSVQFLDNWLRKWQRQEAEYEQQQRQRPTGTDGRSSGRASADGSRQTALSTAQGTRGRTTNGIHQPDSSRHGIYAHLVE
ncbi:MAG: hypothetical protein ACXWP0_13635 [Ktedonobacterales bacterium]